MFALMMFSKKILITGFCISKHNGIKRHPCNLFKGNCIINCLFSIKSPAERSMTVYQHRRDSQRICFTKSLNNYFTGINLIVIFNFLVRSASGCTGPRRNNGRHELFPAEEYLSLPEPMMWHRLNVCEQFRQLISTFYKERRWVGASVEGLYFPSTTLTVRIKNNHISWFHRSYS